jgi:hypothetical protein
MNRVSFNFVGGGRCMMRIDKRSKEKDFQYP